MKSPVEISEHGNLLMYRPEYSVETVRKLIDSQELNGLRIFDHWEPLESLDFLRSFTFLKRLEITCRYDQDYSFLQDMSQLEHFSVGPSFPMNNEIDVSRLTNVRYLSIQWATNRIVGLDRCIQLQDLTLVEFPKSDMAVIVGLVNLVRLRIKTGSMKSLEGVEGLTKLEVLELGNCRNLRSIRQISGLGRLQSMRIESCRKIEDLNSVHNLPSLSNLQFVNCGTIPDLDYSNRFPKLTTFLLAGQTKLNKSSLG